MHGRRFLKHRHSTDITVKSYFCVKKVLSTNVRIFKIPCIAVTIRRLQTINLCQLCLCCTICTVL